MSTKTRSALRATLKQEDAALEERLPEVSPPTAKNAKTVAPTANADTPVTPAADKGDAKPSVTQAGAEPTPAPSTQAEPTAPAKPAAKAKPEKRKHERFKLAASDRRRLGTLGTELKAEGRRPSKSELVRAGIAALAAHGTAEVIALVDTLSPAARAKDKKAGSKRKGKSASKKR